MAENEGKIVLAKVDIDQHAELADDYDVSEHFIHSEFE